MGREKIEITEDFKFFKQQLEAGELYLDEIQSREDCLIFCNSGVEFYVTIEDGKFKITAYS